MFETKDFAVVILNWNGKALLEKFLPSVLKYSQDATIYVADNASTDNSVAFVSEEFPTVKIIKNSQNGGYAKGYNDALKSVKEPLLCLLNSDIEVTENWLQPILKEFKTNKNTAIIQPKILDYKNKTHFEYAGAAGGFLDKFGYPYCRGRIFDSIEEDKGQYNNTSTIFWSSGACLFIRNVVFKELGGFDESYFAHMEEIDLCWRAFNKNYKSKYVGASTVYHVGGATLSNTNSKKTYLNFRNSLFTLVKNTDSNVFIKTIIRMKLDAVAALRFLLQFKLQHFFAILKAHFSFYKNLRRILKQRKQLPKRPNYYECNSIVWSYFIKKRRTF
ncbi:glycosyltransferase family 2 protein [Winogradskyella litoriviva]|uniref:Glycosyltransferase family 2 protein n=1 Tax=Winogradskyella litoriviva TaxID=1220182 RepID=A0ABX2E5H2_9FLAO|nr:glycosyltransferase family 2 protein [Winogradskyella litoriviva]NRD23744.1 glycosyltransferase family 2 protein [Winogradskyella litoriviva]